MKPWCYQEPLVLCMPCVPPYPYLPQLLLFLQPSIQSGNGDAMETTQRQWQKLETCVQGIAILLYTCRPW